MPNLANVRAHNQAALKRIGSNLTSLVVGGTSGIGEATAIKLASLLNEPHIIISGRKKEPAEEVLANLRKTNPQGKYEFRRVDASSIKSIAAFTTSISQKLEKLNYLVISAGILSMQGRTETEEGIDIKLATHYYGRFFLMKQLIPLLEKTADSGAAETRVLSVLGATKGGPLPPDDLDLKKGYSLKAAADTGCLYNDLAVEEFSLRHPSLSFIHASPGGVNTNIGHDLPWYARAPMRLLMPLLAKTPEDAAENMVYALSNEGYKKGWHLVEENGEALAKCRHHTEEARKMVWDHSIALTDQALRH